ncbi:MAG: MFS transporter [Dactylosporangium sp.]|nr:MFS transporter [Dactylosporangium sp.]
MTAPGQTVGVTAFVDPLIRDLELSRSAVSTAYLIGTLTGAALLPVVGRLLDRHGARRCIVAIGVVFGTVLASLSLVSSIVGLTAGFVGIRLAGQGALGLAATTVAASWFHRRRGFALGLVAALGTAGISLSPLVLERLIAGLGWRTAWLVEGVAVWAVVIPVALFGIRDRPADLGQHVDGDPATSQRSSATGSGATRAQALRTPYFWVLTAATAAVGLLATAVGFHQISLLAERGLSPTAAAANFLPQTAAGVAATLAAGVVVDRWQPRTLIVASMAGLACGLVWATVVTPGWSAIGFGIAFGAAGGAVRTVEAAATPRLFGTSHLGAIRGTINAVTVASTAFGPVAFALIHQASGGYRAALLAGAAVPVGVIVAAAVVSHPVRR